MKVKDKLTGLTLECDNEAVAAQWAANPGRYIQEGEKKKETAKPTKAKRSAQCKPVP